MIACIGAQSCPALCDPMNCSLPGSSVHVIFQARILEWVDISSSRGSPLQELNSHILCLQYWKVESLPLHHLGSPFNKIKSEVKLLSHVGLFATPWTVVYQDPQSIGFSKQEYWSKLLFPSPGDLTRVSCIVGRCFCLSYQGSP